MTNDSDLALTLVREFRAKIQEIVKRDNARPMGYEHILFAERDLLEDEILPLLEQFLSMSEWEPSDADLCPGEPPMSMQEMHTAAHVQHLELHS